MSSQENEATNRQAAYRRLIQSYIEAGKEQYNKGFFERAVMTFQDAQKYQEYLTDSGREELRAHLEKAQAAAEKRKLALEKFQTANELMKKGDLAEAKANLESIRNDEYLNKDEHTQIAVVLGQIDIQISNKAKSQITAETPDQTEEETPKPDEQQVDQIQKIADLYRNSMDLYHAGQYEKAREGLIEVASSDQVPLPMKKTIDEYIAQIDKKLSQKAVEAPAPEKKKEPEMIAVIEPKVFSFGAEEPEVKKPVLNPAATSTNQGNYIEQINKKRNILRTYTGTVVNNAIAKANSLMVQGEFDKAKKEIEQAQFTVNENQIHIGEALFKEYSGKLKTVSDEITGKQGESARQAEEAKRKAAIDAQEQFRKQMEADRKKRISELMKNALAYQEQQQYDAALGQLESLLALDPQNNEALILKDTLEDMVFFRKQLEVRKESDRQRADILLKTDESGIPYAAELTYPKNWREIIQKPTRQEDKPIGLDPIDAKVYDQLEQIVDLSDLTSAMSFADVINELKSSVDPPLQIQPNWRDLLENAELEPTTPAQMDPLTGIKLRKALEVLLAGLSSEFAQIGYVVDEGIIVIATEETLPKKMVTRVYDVTDLVGEPAQYGGMMGMMMGMQMGNMISSSTTQGFTTSTGGTGGTGGIGGTTGGYGGGTGGYGGGMGGYGGGMGMMGGGMGGYGGGMMGGMGGYGGGMGGYGGGMMGGGGFMQSQSLVQLIQESIDPESWFDLSNLGEGTITPYPTQQPKKLAVYNTHEVHREIEKLLAALRKALGHQVSIEARFLVVSENFLEDVGLDVDFVNNLGGKWGRVTFEQDSAFITKTAATQVPLSFGGIGVSAASVTGGYGSILDDLQVAFLLRATVAHKDSKALTAPVATVLNGESATFNINRSVIFPLPPVQTQGVVQTGAVTGTTQAGGGNLPQYITVPIGSILTITPVITHDKKNVLLNIITIQNDFLGLNTSQVQAPIIGGGAGEVQTWEVSLPETERSSLMTRVSVPDGGTLLLGGQRITASVEQEAGVPVLSKIPVLGRLFGNRSKVRDQKILLILVKPTILLQEEREAEAIALMESES